MNQQVVVARVYADASPGALPIQVGDVVEQADGVPVAQILARARPYVAASTPAAATREGLRFVLRGQERDSAALTVRTPRGVRTVRLKRSLTIQSPIVATYKDYYFGKNLRDTTLIWRLLPNNIGYVHLGGLPATQMAHVLRLFRQTAGLVLDLRAYPQAGLWQLAAYLRPASVPRLVQGRVGKPGISLAWPRSLVPTPHYPGYSRWSSAATIAPAHGGVYTGRVVVLVNEKTQSYGETLALLFKSIPGIVVVGSQTAGANGNTIKVTLPAGLETYYSGIGMYNQDGSETQRVGIVPDIWVVPSLKGIQSGKDEVLDRAVSHLLAQ